MFPLLSDEATQYHQEYEAKLRAESFERSHSDSLEGASLHGISCAKRITDAHVDIFHEAGFVFPLRRALEWAKAQLVQASSDDL